MRCQATLADGHTPCSRNAREGHITCTQHGDPAERAILYRRQLLKEDPSLKAVLNPNLYRKR